MNNNEVKECEFYSENTECCMRYGGIKCHKDRVCDYQLLEQYKILELEMNDEWCDKAVEIINLNKQLLQLKAENEQLTQKLEKARETIISLKGIIKYCKDMRNNIVFEPLDRLVYMDVPHNRGIDLAQQALTELGEVADK